MSGGAVIFLQSHDFGTWEIFLEAEDVADFSTAPTIDRLILITHAADIFVLLGQ